MTPGHANISAASGKMADPYKPKFTNYEKFVKVWQQESKRDDVARILNLRVSYVKKLAQKMRKRGVLLKRYPTGTPPQMVNVDKLNKIARKFKTPNPKPLVEKAVCWNKLWDKGVRAGIIKSVRAA